MEVPLGEGIGKIRKEAFQKKTLEQALNANWWQLNKSPTIGTFLFAKYEDDTERYLLQQTLLKKYGLIVMLQRDGKMTRWSADWMSDDFFVMDWKILMVFVNDKKHLKIEVRLTPQKELMWRPVFDSQLQRTDLKSLEMVDWFRSKVMQLQSAIERGNIIPNTSEAISLLEMHTWSSLFTITTNERMTFCLNNGINVEIKDIDQNKTYSIPWNNNEDSLSSFSHHLELRIHVPREDMSFQVLFDKDGHYKEKRIWSGQRWKDKDNNSLPINEYTREAIKRCVDIWSRTVTKLVMPKDF